MLMWLTLVAQLALADDDSSFDHAHTKLTAFLDGAVDARGVDYALLASRRDQLDAYLAGVQEVDAAGLSRPQQLALYVNAYNAYTLALMLDNGPPRSIQDLDGGKVWDTRTFVVAGQPLTLNQMEHEHARELADGRIHAVVSCASRGCPPLPARALTSSGQSAQLDAAARAWASSNAFTLEGDTIALSKIFDWYSGDFAPARRGDLAEVEGPAEAALWFLSSFVDEATRDKLLSGTLSARWQDYDWSINKR